MCKTLLEPTSILQGVQNTFTHFSLASNGLKEGCGARQKAYGAAARVLRRLDFALDSLEAVDRLGRENTQRWCMGDKMLAKVPRGCF